MAPRYFPRVVLYKQPRPVLSPAYRFWMAGQLEQQVKTPPGRASNARWIKLDDDQTEYDGMPGAPSSHAPYALTCDYSIEWLATATQGKAGWILRPTPEEDAYRQLDRTYYQNEAERLQAIIAQKVKDKQSHEEEDEQLESVLGILDQLAPGAPGYFKTAFSAMGTNVSGVFYGLKAPNVPMACESAFTLPARRAISLRLERLKAPENFSEQTRQARHEWRLFIANDIGAKSTCYGLIMGEDGNACEFWHFRNMARGKREKLLAQMRAVEDRGRLSPSDHKQLLLWDAEEQAIRAAAKKEKEKTKRKELLTPEQSDRIEDLHQLAQNLKDSKKLTKADEAELSDLKEKLFLAQENFTLQESAQDLIGKPVDFTIHFLESGYIVIACEGSEWVYENKRLTGAHPPIYASGLPKDCRMFIESDGGQWGLVYGRPKYASLVLLGQPFEIDRPVTLAEIEWYFGGKAPEGTSITARLVPVRAASTSPEGILTPGTWQLRINLTTDGAFSPELYWVEMILPPGEMEEAEVVWDSQNPGNPDAPSGNWVQDVLIQSERARGPHLTVHVARPGLDSLPLLLAGLACDVTLYDRQELRSVTMMRSGKVVVNPNARLRRLSLAGEAAALKRVSMVGSEVAFEAVGLQEFLAAECQVPFVLNGEYPNDCLHDLCFYAGLHPALYAGIPTGDIGIPPIPLEQPGRYPELKIAPGTRTLEAMRHIVREYCPGWQLITDTEGLTLVEHAERDKTQQSYGLPPEVDVRSKYCLRNEWSLVQDTSDVITGVTVLGAINPATGVRYSATETIPQMYEEGFEDSVFWIGEERHELCSPDEGLKSDDACTRAARERMNITPLTPDGLAPWRGDIEIDLEAEVREGDVIPIFDVKYLVDSIAFGSLAAEQDAQKMHASCFLAEDRRVAPLEEAP